MSDLGGLFSLRGYRAAGTTVGAGHRSTLTWLLHSFRMTVRLRSSTLTVKVPAVRSAKAKAPRSSEVVMAIQSGQQVEMVTSILASHTWPAMRAWAQRVGIGVAVGPRVPVGVGVRVGVGEAVGVVVLVGVGVTVPTIAAESDPSISTVNCGKLQAARRHNRHTWRPSLIVQDTPTLRFIAFS